MASQVEFLYPTIVMRAGSSETDVINIFKNTLMGFIFPIGFEGATVTLRGRIKPSAEEYDVKDPVTGSAVSIKAGASAWVAINASELASLQYFTIVSPTIVAADREITIICRPAP